MANEVTIVVKARNETKTGFDAARRDADRLGGELGTTITTRTSQRITEASRSSGLGLSQAGDQMGESLGRRIRERITDHVRVAFDRIRLGRQNVDVDVHEHGGRDRDRERVHVDVDVDKQSIFQRFGTLGKDLGDKLSGSIGGSLSTFFSGDLASLLIKVVAGAVIAGVSLPIVGAAISAAVLTALGGGVIAAGVVAAFKDPQIRAAAMDLRGQLGRLFATFGESFKRPVANFLEAIPALLKQISPMVQHLGKVFGPITDKLGQGLIGLLQNALPGILRAAESAAPLFDVLAQKLPEIGDALGSFFDHISSGGPGATQFFSDLLDAMAAVIRILGVLIGGFSRAYIIVRRVFAGMAAAALEAMDVIINAAAHAFNWVPGLGPKLAAAARNFNNFKETVNRHLAAIHDRTVTVRIRQVFTTVGGIAAGVAGILAGHAHGGIVGAASGGIHGGLRLVGEAGPELAELPPGTRVHPTGATQRMLGGGGGGSTEVILRAASRADSDLMTAILKALRYEVRAQGGDVQQALGVGR